MAAKKNPDSALREATEEEILNRLADGDSLVTICRAKGMPCRMTVQRWQDADPEFDVAVMRAREAGMFVRAERAVENAKAAEDAPLGRLAFDAERWYVGKLSNAFSDDKARKHVVGGPNDGPVQVEQVVTDADAFTRAIAGIVARTGTGSGTGEAAG